MGLCHSSTAVVGDEILQAGKLGTRRRCSGLVEDAVHFPESEDVAEVADLRANRSTTLMALAPSDESGALAALDLEMRVIDQMFHDSWESCDSIFDYSNIAHTSLHNFYHLRGELGKVGMKLVYKKYCSEITRCVDCLADSIRKVQENPHARLMNTARGTLQLWLQLERHYHFVPFAFRVYETYNVPQFDREALHAVKVKLTAEANLEEKAEMMWRTVATAIRHDDARTTRSGQLGLVCEAWDDLACSFELRTSGIVALREHLAIELRWASALEAPCGGSTASLMLPSLACRLAVDFLSDVDVFEAYQVRCRCAH
eukprot:TRINITY_DN48871_c0_g1_i1.p1 TRINITY_DN48871_c0_g1~~TRINITY_DN48871_c0_g1_i1.p1  ORF type:complete len:315 (-),score=32.97 TRINITY_DN48871_c0_g1_i1:168-1112(-)